MSVQAISWVLDHSRSSGNERCVLISIANHCDKFGRGAYQSQVTTGREANCARRTVQRCIERLFELGELDWFPNLGIGKRRKTNLYFLPFMLEGVNLPLIPDELMPEGVIPVSEGDRLAVQKASPVAQEPSLNRPIEPRSLLTKAKDTAKTAEKVRSMIDELAARRAMGK